MKIAFKKTLLASVMVMTSASAFADNPTLDLKVTGKIMSPSCTPIFSGDGIVDFGTIDPAKLSPTADTMLDQAIETQLDITCAAPAKVAFTVQDMRVSSIPSSFDDMPVGNDFGNGIGGGKTNTHAFGLGMTGSNTIGVYGLRITEALGDNDTKLTILTSEDKLTWSSFPDGVNILNKVSWNYSFGDTAPVANKNFKVKISVNAAVNDTTTMPVNDEITLDGLSTFTLVYL